MSETLTAPKTASTTPITHKPLRGRSILKPIGFTLVAFAVSQVVVWGMLDLDRNTQTKLFLICGVVAGIAIVICSLFNRAAPSGQRMMAIACGFVFPVFCVGMLRQDGYLGDGTRVLEWRFAAAPVQTINTKNAVVSSSVENETAVQAASSSGFLGRNRDGVVRNPALNTDWTANPPRELWRRTVGPGWSSFAVANGKAMTQEQRPDGEATVCYELNTGSQIWVHLEPTAHFSEQYGGDGPRATPTFDDNRVFSLGATGILNCLDADTGKSVWSSNILETAKARNLIWAISGSPLVYDNLVVVNAGGQDGYSMIAYDKTSGHVAWHSGDSQASYCSPVLATLCGVRQVVMLNGAGLEGYEASTGKRLWDFPFQVNGSTACSISQPVILPATETDQLDRVFISGGYGKGCVLVELQRDGVEIKATAAWPENQSIKSKMSNMVARDGMLWGLDNGIMVCVEIDTGRRQWKAGRYGHGQLLMLDDAILVQKESGQVALVAPDSSKHEEMARFSALSSKTWNHPVIVGNLLLVRNDREAVCFELPRSGETRSPGLARRSRVYDRVLKGTIGRRVERTYHWTDAHRSALSPVRSLFHQKWSFR